MAIRNWRERELLMDFSSMYQGNNHPCDIDLMYIGKDKGGRDVLIVGEIKNVNGTLREGQKHILERFVSKYNGTAIILYITHNKRVEEGATVVNVANCRVERYYYQTSEGNGKWVEPKDYLTVKDVIDTYREGG